MGAHGTCEEALRNVAAFHTAAVEDERIKIRSGKKAKEKDKKKKKKGSKSEKHGKYKKDVKQKKAKKQRSSSGDDSSSQGGSDVETREQELERGRAAVRVTRDIMSRYPEVKQDLRELLRTLDSGKGVDLAGLPDPTLRGLLSELLSNLGLHKSSKGLHIKRPGAPALLPQLVLVLDETPAAPSKPSQAAPLPHMPHVGPTTSTPPTGSLPSTHMEPMGPPPPRRAPTDPLTGEGGESDREHASLRAPGTGGGSGDERAKAEGHAMNGRALERDMREHEEEQEEEKICGIAVIGPDMGPLGSRTDDPPDVVEDVVDSDSDYEDDRHTERDALPGEGRKVLGPVMPPPGYLAAAAQAPYPVDEDGMEDDDDFDLIGPMPPALVAEMDAAGDDVRSQEVARVLRVMDPNALEDPNQPRDAYEVLGVPLSATPGEIKKRYMRLSLLIHPDKCSHPRANDAFQAVSAAAKDLQDSGKRAAVDAARDAARSEKIARELEEQEERQRQWRVVRGEGTAEDLKGPARRGPQARDTWMTHLPTERRAPTQMSQTSVTAFSRLGTRERGDTRDWTETPAQRQLRLEAGGGGGPALLGPADASAARHAAEAAAAVDQFNREYRKKSLMEQHQDKLKAKDKEKKKKRKAEGPAGQDKPDWEGTHPWRPFDRDKDLLAGPARPTSKEELLKKSGDLSGRFATGGSNGKRSFL